MKSETGDHPWQVIPHLCVHFRASKTEILFLP